MREKPRTGVNTKVTEGKQEVAKDLAETLPVTFVFGSY